MNSPVNSPDATQRRTPFPGLATLARRLGGIPVRLLKNPWRLRFMVPLAAALLTILVVSLVGPRLTQWDESSASLSWSFADDSRVERRVVIVDIDERSVQAVGPWPWPRARQAELLEKLDAAGVSLKMLDILFEGSSRDDPRLARALANGAPTVQAQLFSLDPQVTMHSGHLGGALPFGSVCPQAAEPAYGYMASEITPRGFAGSMGSMGGMGGMGGINYTGHITPLVDPDGAIRQIPALICFDGKTYATLGVAGLLAASDATPVLRQEDSLLAPYWWLDLGAVRLPLDRAGHLRVSYQMPRAGFVSISAIDVLNGQAPPDMLRGAWALVGATAFGARDVVPTPLGRAVSGVEVHAQVLSAMLDGRSPFVPRGAPLWPWLAGAIGALLLLGALRLAPRAPHIALPVTAVAIVAGLFGINTALLLGSQLWLGWVVPGLFILFAATLLGAVEFARTRFERELLYRNLASYLPESVAREIATREPDAQVCATRREATVLHADLRNFSAYCEGRPPEETAMVLHLFFTTASRIVEEHGGVVEQMVGDSLLAVWNGSAPCADHGVRALNAAEALWRACVPQLPHIESPVVPPLDLGIGVETGSILVGSFGPAARRTHTVLGEAVTVATRLQALTGELAYPILAGANVAAVRRDTVSSDGSGSLLRLGDFLLNGLTRPRTIYALPVDLAPSHLRLIHDASTSRNVA